jgi:hypothetical protein
MAVQEKAQRDLHSALPPPQCPRLLVLARLLRAGGRRCGARHGRARLARADVAPTRAAPARRPDAVGRGRCGRDTRAQTGAAPTHAASTRRSDAWGRGPGTTSCSPWCGCSCLTRADTALARHTDAGTHARSALTRRPGASGRGRRGHGTPAQADVVDGCGRARRVGGGGRWSRGDRCTLQRRRR